METAKFFIANWSAKLGNSFTICILFCNCKGNLPVHFQFYLDSGFGHREHFRDKEAWVWGREGRGHFFFVIFYYQYAKSEVSEGRAGKDIKIFVC